MAIRDKFRDSVQPLLEPGEEIQAVFGAQSHSAWLMVVTGIIPFLFFNKYYVIAATDRRIVIARSGAFQVAKAREIVAEAPRQTRVGPASGLWYKTESLGLRTYIHKRFHGDVNHADELSGGSAPLPPPPA